MVGQVNHIARDCSPLTSVPAALTVGFFLLTTLASAFLLAISISPAQTLNRDTPGVLLEQQRQAEEQKKKQDLYIQPQVPPAIEKQITPAPPPPPDAKLLVSRITFTGNTVFKSAELERVVAPAVGKELSLRELNEFIGKVTDYYVAHGYILAQAYLPPQEIRDGIVEVAILEGEVGTIQVTGNKRYRSSTILNAMEPVKKRHVLNESVLETALNELNDYPGLKVRAALKPGERRGFTDLQLTAEERIPYTLAFNVDNYGSRLTGPWRYGSTIGIGNLTGLGDNLTLQGLKSNTRLFFTNVGYLIPISHAGTKLGLNWIHSENVIGKEFGATRPVGRADIVSGDIYQTITKTSVFALSINGGFDFKTIRNIISGSLANGSKDELRVFRLGLRGEYNDRWLGRNFFGLTVHEGVDFWGASTKNAPGTSFQVAPGQGGGPGYWTTLTGDLARYQSLGFPFIQKLPVLPVILNESYLILRATGQLASDRLLSPERFSIGGYYTVRGYPVSEKIGDSGYAATAELVVPVPSSRKIPFSNLPWKQVVQFAAFIDHGAVFVSPVSLPSPPRPQEYLTGAGVGLRITLPFGVPQPVDRGLLSLKVDWASAIGRPRPSSRDQGINIPSIYGDGAAGVLYVSAALQF
jgi:hemolysin activation/secretion protein